MTHTHTIVGVLAAADNQSGIEVVFFLVGTTVSLIAAGRETTWLADWLAFDWLRG